MENSKIKIFISGDFVPNLRVSTLLLNGEYDAIFNEIFPIIQDADFAITNLEAPLIDGGTAIFKTGPNLRANTKAIQALKYAGFDMVTLANNHMMDYGSEGLRNTLSLCNDNGIKTIGAGTNLQEKSSIVYRTLKGKTIAFLNCCENEWSTMSDDGCGCNPLDEVEIYYQIKEAKSKAEQLIMLVHGGHETYEFPSPRMKKLYRWFIDLGADAVVGHHTHCYSGREVYKGKPIIYSLGNFIFDHAKWHDNFWTRGCACVLEIDSNDLNATIVPFHQCEKEVGIRLFYDAEYATFKRHDAQKTDVIKDDVLLSVNFDVFVAKQKKMFDAMLEPKPNKIYLLLRKLGVPFSLLSKSKRRLYLNLIRCESHRDILFGTLKSTIK